MQVPRAYHTHVRVSTELCDNCVLVFGGVSQSDDPFGDDEPGPPGIELLSYGNNKLHPTMQHHIPSLVGGAACSVNARTFFVAGGVDTHEVQNVHKHDTLGVFRWSSDGETIKTVRTNIKLSVPTGNDKADNDLGVCAHHCLISLPNSSEAAALGDDASAVLVGGGVPAFSFGQSYSK